MTTRQNGGHGQSLPEHDDEFVSVVLVSHGSGGSRGRLPAPRPHARAPRLRRARARQPRQRRERRPLQRPRRQRPAGRWRRASTTSRGAPTCSPDRIAGFGLSLGGEVLLEAAAHDRRLAAVVSDGAARPHRPERRRRRGRRSAADHGAADRSRCAAISGMRTSRSLVGMMPAHRAAPGAPGRRRRRPRGDPDGRARTATRAAAACSCGRSRTPPTRAACASTRGVRAADRRLPRQGTLAAAVDTPSAVGLVW